MALRLELAEGDSVVGLGLDSRVGTRLRRRLYQNGAKSGVDVIIGVRDRDSLGAPKGMIDQLLTLPSSSCGSGRINIPFSAYLSGTLFVRFHDLLLEPSRRFGIPLGVVSGVCTWAHVLTSVAGTPEQIRSEAPLILGVPVDRKPLPYVESSLHVRPFEPANAYRFPAPRNGQRPIREVPICGCKNDCRKPTDNNYVHR